MKARKDGVLFTEDDGTPLLVSLDSPFAFDPSLVGEGAMLLAELRDGGLPVPAGVVVTEPGLQVLGAGGRPHGVHTLRRAGAWLGGSALLQLSCVDPELTHCALGPAPCSADRWDELLVGLTSALAHDLAENPACAPAGWAMLLLRAPEQDRSFLAMTGDPLRGEDRVTLWDLGADDALPLSGWQRCRLVALARRAQAALGRAVDLQIHLDPTGNEWIVDCRLYDPRPAAGAWHPHDTPA